MKTKDKQDEAQRHAQRNYVIKEVRNQLVTYQGCSFTEADILIGRIWGVGDRKIREIVRSKSFLAVSAADLTKLAVSLQQILNDYGDGKHIDRRSVGAAPYHGSF